VNCCHRCAASAQFDDAVAQRDLRRFRRRGADAPTRQLVAAVQNHPLPPQPTLLDIGGGIGAIHHLLLEQGFTEATHLDASGTYLAVAEDEAKRVGHADRVRFLHADFPRDGSAIPPVDVVTLDRVVCCDPDYVRLLGVAADHSRRLLAFSYPRGRWLVRLAVAGSNAVRRLRGHAFRVYMHPPAEMRAVLENAGMRQTWAGGTWTWAVELFERAT